MAGGGTLGRATETRPVGASGVAHEERVIDAVGNGSLDLGFRTGLRPQLSGLRRAGFPAG